jgi:hypothetical protein
MRRPASSVFRFAETPDSRSLAIPRYSSRASLLKELGLRLICLAALLMTGCHREVSGAYMAKFPNAVVWLQLVKTPDNHLTGQFVGLTLEADGKIDEKNANVAGAVDGETMILSTAGIFGVQGGTLSGNLNGNKLTLTGPQLAPVVLNRANLNEYQREVNALSVKSRHIFATKANVELLNKIDSTITQMQEFDAQVDLNLSKLLGAEEHLHAITAQISGYVNRERQLAGSPNTAVARGQLDVAAYQASITTTQLHNTAQSLQSALETSSRSMSAETEGLGRWCGGRGLVDLMPAEIQARATACDRLFRTADLYKQKAEALTHGLSHFEQIYAEESGIQEGLLHTADRLE